MLFSTIYQQQVVSTNREGLYTQSYECFLDVHMYVVCMLGSQNKLLPINETPRPQISRLYGARKMSACLALPCAIYVADVLATFCWFVVCSNFLIAHESVFCLWDMWRCVCCVCVTYMSMKLKWQKVLWNVCKTRNQVEHLLQLRFW